jgi:hypothetical protein
LSGAGNCSGKGEGGTCVIVAKPDGSILAAVGTGPCSAGSGCEEVEAPLAAKDIIAIHSTLRFTAISFKE